ncbi:MAG: DUF5915 domain-containing protein [Candidatus Promineifilaceae bacterium]
MWMLNAPRSVHHCLYPEADAAALDQRLLDKMRLAITTASLGRSARGEADLKLRQPLARARVNVGSAQEEQDLRELADVLKEEINVKAIEIVSEVGELVNYKLMPNNRVMGPKYGQQFPAIRQALAKVDPVAAARLLQSGQSLTLSVSGQTLELGSDEVLVQTESRGGLAVASEKGVTVAVDTELTPELIQEGYARDFVRQINDARKNLGFEINDRVHVYVQDGDAEVSASLTTFSSYIQQETLALSLETVAEPPANGSQPQTAKIGDNEATFWLVKA